MKITKKITTKVCSLYTKNKITQYKIAKICKISICSVHNILINNKITLRKMTNISRHFKVNENFFDKINNEKKAYWLGFITADGAITGNKTLRIELSSKDHTHIEKFKKDIESEHNVNVYTKNNKKYSYIAITNKKIKHDLAKYGVVGNKTHKTFFPNISNKLKHHFIRGYFDGDGWISKYIGVAGSELIIKEITKIFKDELDIKNIKSYIIGKNKLTYQIQIYSKENKNKVLNYIYKNATVFLERKYVKYQLILKPTKRFKIGIDCHGVIDDTPDFFSTMGELFVRAGHQVHIITGASITDRFIKHLTKNKMYKGIHYTHLFSITDYLLKKGTKVIWADSNNPWFDTNSWNVAKADYCREQNIDIHFDDSEEYGNYFTTPFYLKKICPVA